MALRVCDTADKRKDKARAFELSHIDKASTCRYEPAQGSLQAVIEKINGFLVEEKKISTKEFLELHSSVSRELSLLDRQGSLRKNKIATWT